MFCDAVVSAPLALTKLTSTWPFCLGMLMGTPVESLAANQIQLVGNERRRQQRVLRSDDDRVRRTVDARHVSRAVIACGKLGSLADRNHVVHRDLSGLRAA